MFWNCKLSQLMLAIYFTLMVGVFLAGIIIMAVVLDLRLTTASVNARDRNAFKLSTRGLGLRRLLFADSRIQNTDPQIDRSLDRQTEVELGAQSRIEDRESLAFLAQKEVLVLPRSAPCHPTPPTSPAPPTTPTCPAPPPPLPASCYTERNPS